MVEYIENGDVAIYNGLRYRKDKQTGYYLNAKTHKRLHRAVYENEVGEIPRGYHVHHIDLDKDNNEPSNLVLLAPTEHHKVHDELMTDEQREAKRTNVRENALPKAVEWHGSDKGKEWHSGHASRVWLFREKRSYICTNCGTEFRSRNIYGEGQNRFCSGKCRAAFRRKSGVDDVIKVCERCGNEYRANRYQKTRYCDECKSLVH